tara:strand:- start:195 stop:506 length:312 start_codon:yes stop_codon:yes gene_type:complete
VVSQRKRSFEEKEKRAGHKIGWIWTLEAFTELQTNVEPIADIEETGKSLAGLRLSGSISAVMDVYFDKGTPRLVRIYWRSDIHRFSDWKQQDKDLVSSSLHGE